MHKRNTCFPWLCEKVRLEIGSLYLKHHKQKWTIFVQYYSKVMWRVPCIGHVPSWVLVDVITNPCHSRFHFISFIRNKHCLSEIFCNPTWTQPHRKSSPASQVRVGFYTRVQNQRNSQIKWSHWSRARFWENIPPNLRNQSSSLGPMLILKNWGPFQRCIGDAKFLERALSRFHKRET